MAPLAADSVFSEETLAQNGTGASVSKPTQSNAAVGADGSQDAQLVAAKADVEKALTAFGGESMTMEMALRHVVTKVTDEGLGDRDF